GDQSKTYPSWEESRLEQEEEEQYCILIPPCSCPIFDSLEGCLEGSETLEQTFNRLQVIASQMEFMDIEIKKDDLNQKFLTSLAPEWLMHMIVWRNRSDLDAMSLDDLYNHLKVYESEVQKKSESNS
nr:hypothetical protein [Tanacetum cinerariifolium]